MISNTSNTERPKPMDVDDLNLTFPAMIAFLGSLGTGKTNSMKVLCRMYSSCFDLIFLFAPYADEETWLPDNCRVNVIDLDTLERICEYQRANNTTRILIIFDDVLRRDRTHINLLNNVVMKCQQNNMSLFISFRNIIAVRDVKRVINHFIINRKVIHIMDTHPSGVATIRNEYRTFIYTPQPSGRTLMNMLLMPLCEDFEVDVDPRLLYDVDRMIHMHDIIPNSTVLDTRRETVDYIVKAVHLFKETDNITEIVEQLKADMRDPNMSLELKLFVSGIVIGIDLVVSVDTPEVI
jgi:hypothetical protein